MVYAKNIIAETCVILAYADPVIFVALYKSAAVNINDYGTFFAVADKIGFKIKVARG